MVALALIRKQDFASLSLWNFLAPLGELHLELMSTLIFFLALLGVSALLIMFAWKIPALVGEISGTQ